MATRKHKIFERDIVMQATLESFRKLNPVSMMKNPVMFV